MKQRTAYNTRIEKIIQPRIDYSTFIEKDLNPEIHKEILLNLFYSSKFYKFNKIQLRENPDKSDYRPTYSLKNRHKLHLMKIALLDNNPNISALPMEQSFYNLQNYILILAMIKKSLILFMNFLKMDFLKVLMTRYSAQNCRLLIFSSLVF